MLSSAFAGGRVGRSFHKLCTETSGVCDISRSHGHFLEGQRSGCLTTGRCSRKRFKEPRSIHAWDFLKMSLVWMSWKDCDTTQMFRSPSGWTSSFLDWDMSNAAQSLPMFRPHPESQKAKAIIACAWTISIAYHLSASPSNWYHRTSDPSAHVTCCGHSAADPWHTSRGRAKSIGPRVKSPACRGLVNFDRSERAERAQHLAGQVLEKLLPADHRWEGESPGGRGSTVSQTRLNGTARTDCRPRQTPLAPLLA